MGTLIRLLLMGLLVVVLFKIAKFLLPFVLLGFVVVFLKKHFEDDKKNEIVVRNQ